MPKKIQVSAETITAFEAAAARAVKAMRDGDVDGAVVTWADGEHPTLRVRAVDDGKPLAAKLAGEALSFTTTTIPAEAGTVRKKRHEMGLKEAKEWTPPGPTDEEVEDHAKVTEDDAKAAAAREAAVVAGENDR